MYLELTIACVLVAIAWRCFNRKCAKCVDDNAGFLRDLQLRLEYIKTSIWLYLCQSPEAKFDLGKHCCNGKTGVELGFLPNPSDVVMEEPREMIDNGIPQKDQVMLIGGDTKTSILLIVSRSNQGITDFSLVVNLPDGTSLTNSKHPDTRFQSRNNSFNCEGLKLTCLTALRKWRISYNGILINRESNNEDGVENAHHVQFTLLWKALSIPQKGYETKTQLLVKQLASKRFQRNSKNLERLEDDMKGYEQWGMFQGTMRIDSQEVQEVLLWGVKERTFGTPNIDAENSRERLYCFTEDGKSIRLTKNVLADGEHVRYGYFVPCVLRSSQIKWTCADSIIGADTFEGKSIHISNGSKCYDLKVNKVQTAVSFLSGNQCETTVKAKFYKTFMDAEIGWAVGLESSRSEETMEPFQTKIFLESSNANTGPHVVAFSNELCESSYLCGGKGSSLALLMKLSSDTNRFKVPNGCVITTEGYWHHLRKNRIIGEQIKYMKNIAWSKLEGNIDDACNTVVAIIKNSTLSSHLETAIVNELRLIFGEEFADRKFAVRSSAIGEDSEDLSAAGQNETILGVIGIKQIFEALLQCWASQFKFTAVQYKKQNGQELNSGMAVVIQEMVPSETAGVMFTQDPVTGNPSIVSISANYGLGESVVSGVADPDSFQLKKTHGDVEAYKVDIGEKRVRINLRADGGTTTLESSSIGNAQPCLSDELILNLGRVGLLVEERFGDTRDVEWAVVGIQIYLLQSRPVTSSDIEAEYELTHEMDSAVNSKYDITSNCNVQEVCPGPTSHLSLDFTMRSVDLSTQRARYLMENSKRGFQYNPFQHITIKYAFNIMSIDLLNVLMMNNAEIEDKTGFTILKVSIIGYNMDSTEWRKRAVQRFGYTSAATNAIYPLKVFLQSIFYDRRIKKLEATLDRKFLHSENYTDPLTLYNDIVKQMGVFFESSTLHTDASGCNIMLNIILISILAGKSEEWPTGLWSDVSKLLATCGELESASVPKMLSELAKSISLQRNWSEFQSLTTKDAKDWLDNDTGVAGKKYKEFMQIHSHRCLREFDFVSIPWGMNPEVLIKTLQTMTVEDDLQKVPPQEKSDEEIISSLQTPLTNTQRKILLFLLPRAKRAVARREKTKSLCVRAVHCFRLAFRQLAKLMVWEGRLPEEDAVFFLTLDELGKLLATRSPKLVSKAMRRKKLQPKLNTIKLGELMFGLPKPVAESDINIEVDINAVTVKGTPMSEGIVQGIARVITRVEDAPTIQAGEILVTEATDIGWSPYFPILGGVVTELGGIISHGAVVAREYGLPCLIGARMATKIIKTGDKVVLDSTKGLLIKLND